MTQSILVTGGTGTLGSEAVARLLADGHEVRVLSRHEHAGDDSGRAWARGNLASGEGLDGAVRGVDTILHCASGMPPGRVDIDGTRRLVAAARAAGGSLPHLVYISIVGVDRSPFRYYRAKYRTEEVVAHSGLPWTILRATQFHDLILGVLRQLARLPILFLPAETAFQPVDAAEVAARLADLATGESAGRVPDMGGPQVRPIEDLARAYIRAAGLQRSLRPLRGPGQVLASFRAGHQLAPDHADGTRTWEEFLAERLDSQTRTS